MGGSKSSQTTNQTTRTFTNNLNLQGVEGIALAQSHGNTIITSDAGALEAARDIATTIGGDALTMADRAGERVLDAAGQAFDFGHSALQFADAASDRTIAGILDSQTESLLFADRAAEREGGVLRDAFDFGEGILGKAADFARSIVTESQSQLGQTVSNINQIARQQSTSDNERIQQLAQRALLIGGALVVVVVIAMAVRKG